MALAKPDMNVTPLIDVLLVLLVIFMAALPLTQKALDADIPSQTQPRTSSNRPNQIVLEYTADGRISINQEDVALAALQRRLTAIYEARHDRTLFIAGAGTLKYQAIVNVIDAAKGAGVDRVGIITDGMRKASAAAQ